MPMSAEPAEKPHLFLGNDQLAWFSLWNKHFHFWTNIFTLKKTFSLPRIPPRQVSENSGGRPPRLQVNPAVQERQEQVKVTVNCNFKIKSSSTLLLAGPTNSLGLLFQIFSISYFCKVDGIVWIILFSCLSYNYLFPHEYVFQEISGQSWPWPHDMTLHIEIGVIFLKYFLLWS